MQQLIQVLKAIGDETRLRIIKLLQERDQLCVCEIMQALGISQTRASRNLGILKNAGFVKDRREGFWIYYSINKKEVNEYHQMLNRALKKWLNDEKVIKDDRERLKKAIKLSKKTGRICKRR